MRIGLLGAGRIGRIHGRNIAAHPRATLAAVADADDASARATAMAAGATVKSVEAIIGAPDIDAVFVCTPTDTHADLIERAARTGEQAEASTRQANIAAGLPALREAEAKAAAALQRLIIAREALDREEARAKEDGNGHFTPTLFA